MNTREQVTQQVRDTFDAVCRGRVEAAVKAEHEACAKAVEAEAHMFETLAAAKSLASTIRARGNP